MDSVKRAKKMMLVLAIIPAFLCVVGIVAYFITDRGGDVLGILSGWTCFSVAIVSHAQGAIKTLQQEIESLKLGGSEAPAATDSESTESADE